MDVGKLTYKSMQRHQVLIGGRATGSRDEYSIRDANVVSECTYWPVYNYCFLHQFNSTDGSIIEKKTNFRQYLLQTVARRICYARRC
jgi:hypothetical protein